MLLYFIFCNILCIPLVLGITTTSKPGHNSTPTTISHVPNELKVELKVKEVNETKGSLVSEGGTIVENTPSLVLLKANSTNLSKELGTDIISAGPSKVVGRKGVVYTNDNVTNTQIKQDNATDPKETLKNLDEKSNEYKKITPIGPKSDLENVTKTPNLPTIQSKKTNKTELHKKPTILSFEALANMDQASQNDLKIPAMKSSSKTIVADQMPSPEDESETSSKVHPMSASRHPEMVMPVIITILVVPMFAVLGYMALRRGQEAWKNRHYKRMDFLLDGMYND